MTIVCNACKHAVVYDLIKVKRQIVRNEKEGGMDAVSYVECPACHSNVTVHITATKPDRTEEFVPVPEQQSTIG